MSTELQQRILAFINGGAGDFESLALEVFAFQREHNAVYRAYCDRQPPVKHWPAIPAVPTSAFKEFAITCFPVAEAVAEFHTSGTTRANAGKHYFKTLELYDAASVPNFRAHLRPENLPMLILTPTPTEAPHSSLAHMLGVVAGDDAEFFVENGTLQLERLQRRLCEMQWQSQPVLLIGTAFAFVHLFDANMTFELPAGSRAMETGGFKGRSREVPKVELYRLFRERLGIDHVVNEYGMTELSTQFYDGAGSIKDVPPWARVLVINPATGQPAAVGQPGLIRVFDLANLWSSLCVQTEDLGVAQADGRFEILGRVAGAEVRGCSLNAESLLKS
ncbi:MAG: long-chain fatty acid--CoA ligase [Verrucomicrobiota bacterium]